jgi:hypothetical protein
MMVQALSFEIANFRLKTVETYLVENTLENQEKYFTHRFTRELQLVQMFDFQFAKEKNVPADFINWGTELENEIDEIDEMTGCFA